MNSATRSAADGKDSESALAPSELAAVIGSATLPLHVESEGVGGVCRDHRSAVFSSAHVEWGTPPDLRAALDKEFHFTLDPCTPGQLWDGLILDWRAQRVFCNPPYGPTIGKWLAKAEEAALAVFLLPARTDTKWFHDYALKADEIRFFRGRLRFAEKHIIPHVPFSGTGAPFPSMLVIFRAGGGGGFSSAKPSSAATSQNAELSDGAGKK